MAALRKKIAEKKAASSTPRADPPPAVQPKVQQQLDPQVQQLMDMGFAQAACEGALRTEESFEAAMEKLLSSSDTSKRRIDRTINR